MSAQDIFDFETVLPLACKSVLVAAGLNVWIIADDPQYQKLRPRTEIVYRHLGESKPRRVAVLPDGSKRGSAFLGELKIFAITESDAPGKIVHSAYRAIVRSQLGGLQDVLNGQALLFHKIQWLEPGHEETGVRTGDGYQQTTFPFQVMLSIQADAWGQLTT